MNETTVKIVKNSRLKEVLKELNKNRLLTLMVLPAVLLVFLFSYIPMAGIIIAFKDFNYAEGIFGSDWVGFDNFKFLFTSGMISRVTFNTVAYNIVFILMDIFFQISAAVILSEISGKYFKKVSQTILLMPFFISWVVAGAVIFNMLSYDTGFINTMLVAFGHQKNDFMNIPQIWPFLFIFFHVWKGVGYGTVIYLAAISSIDQEIYEAAQIDGAGMYQRLFEITLPSLKPTMILLVLLNLGNIVKGDFAMFYNLTGNNVMLYNVSDIIDTFVFRSLLQNQNFSMSGAAGIYQSVLGFVIIMTVNTITKKVNPDYALF